MQRHTRIVLIALALGLLLALLIIFFLPEEIPGGRSFFPQTPESSPATSETNAELLQAADDELQILDRDFNFNAQPTEEEMISPDITLETDAAAE